jgi:hypothetical protein
MDSSNAAPHSFGVSVLRSAATALFGVFVVSVVLRVLPPRLLDPLWQVSFGTALLDMGGYALIGVAVLTIADLLEPGDPRLQRQLWQVTRLCRFAALGYLLLLPMLLSALARDYQHVEQLAQRRQLEVSQQELRLRQAITSAQTRPELLGVVQRINAPALGSFLVSDAPLERQRLQAQVLLRDTAASAHRQAGAVSPSNLSSLLWNNLRLLLLALVFSFGFSSAHRGGPSFPVLPTLLFWLLDLMPAGSREQSSTLPDYLDQDG